MTTNTSATPGADDVYLVISNAGIVELRCDVHPQYSAWCEHGRGGTVPVSWILDVLAAHSEDHAAAPETAHNDAPADPATAATAAELDQFGRDVAAKCRWAMDHNEGDPDDTWDRSYRLAVALVLGNHEYLQDMEPGPGYRPEQAAVLLVRSLPQPPADLDAWTASVRAAITRPGHDPRQHLRLPPTQLRTDR